MAKRKTIRKIKRQLRILDKKFPLRMQKKLVILFMTILLAFVVLIGRITYLNAFRGEKYTKIVLDQQQYGSRIIPYKRGAIVDRNGTTMALSERVYNVILDVYVLTDDEKNIEPTVQVLEDVFGIPKEESEEVIKENPESRYQILKKGVSYDMAQEFKKIDEDDENYPDVKGIWLEHDYHRKYPYDSLASDVIGFTVAGNQGVLGIENEYDSVLNGTDGREYGYFGDDSTLERTVKAPKNGYTVVSTIDVTLQSIVEKAIEEFNNAHYGEVRPNEPGSKNTAVMIMNPNTGEILAEASYPKFDLNNPRDLSVMYSDETINAMTEQEKVDALNLLWRNFCVSDAFEPGSTMKPFTVAAALETGKITGDESYVCGGSIHVGDEDIACHLTTGHGPQTVEQAIANSCNVALMHIAATLGPEDFLRYQHIFGFGEYTGIDLPGEASTSELIHSLDTLNEVELATSSFGQGFNTTMTQLLSGFNSLINGGNYYKPHVVKQIQDETGKVVETREPVILKKTISPEVSEQVKGYMAATMDYGTGKPAAVEGYDIGAKTGTAEKLPRGNGKHLLSYIGFAPLDNPEVVVYVVIDEPNVPDQAVSSYVLELSQTIMAEAFPYLNITMNTPPAEETTGETDTVEE